MIIRVRSIISLTWTHSCQRPVLNHVKDQRPLPLSPRALQHGFERTGRTTAADCHPQIGFAHYARAAYQADEAAEPPSNTRRRLMPTLGIRRRTCSLSAAPLGGQLQY